MIMIERYQGASIFLSFSFCSCLYFNKKHNYLSMLIVNAYIEFVCGYLFPYIECMNLYVVIFFLI
jgi:hypothetical protein